MSKRDFYEVLGVGRSATPEQIKSAYRRLARKYHPDVNKAADASDRFREATEAYEVLGDPQARRKYDQFGFDGPRPSGGGPGGPRGYGWPGGGGARRGAPVDFEEMFGGFGGRGFAGMNLDDLLEALGGGSARRSGRPFNVDGESPAAEDAESEINLDFLQAARGGTVRIQLPRGDLSGRVRTETLDVRIPPGVRDGSRIRLRGKGGRGRGGGGDLYLIVHVGEHPYFRRIGDDIHVDVPVSIVEAALGAKVDVPTIDGMTTVTIPPGSPAGRKLRLRGKGVHSTDGSRGDQYVVIRVTPPPKVSARAAGILRQFEAAEPFDPRGDAPWR